jgi:hypothetical protein
LPYGRLTIANCAVLALTPQSKLFTKAYETFKVQAVPKDRVTFFMAYRIAETYCASGKYDLGAK